MKNQNSQHGVTEQSLTGSELAVETMKQRIMHLMPTYERSLLDSMNPVVLVRFFEYCVRNDETWIQEKLEGWGGK